MCPASVNPVATWLTTSATPCPKALFLCPFRFCSSAPVCENYSPLILNGRRRSDVDRQAEKRGALAVYEGNSKKPLVLASASKLGAGSRSHCANHEDSSTAADAAFAKKVVPGASSGAASVIECEPDAIRSSYRPSVRRDAASAGIRGASSLCVPTVWLVVQA